MYSQPDITTSAGQPESTVAVQEQAAGDTGDGSLLRWVKLSTAGPQPSLAAGPLQPAALPSPKM